MAIDNVVDAGSSGLRALDPYDASVAPISHHVLSIDYGTSNTVAVLRGPDGRRRPLLFDGSPLLPSAVFVDEAGSLLVGRDAQHSARLDPARYEPNPKRRVDEGTILLGTQQVEVVDAIAVALSRAVEEATRAAGGAPSQLRMTYPAMWGPQRRGVLIQAAQRARLPAPELVAEPVAAAVYFSHLLGDRAGAPRQVVVYDLGAGTLDVAVVACTADGYEILATDGLDNFGGVDVDAMIIECVAATAAAADPEQWQALLSAQTTGHRRAARALWHDAREAKEMLSRTTSTAIHVPLVDRDVHITRDELEAKALGPLDDASMLTRRILHRVGQTPGTALFLVGGSSRLPLVATSLHRRTGIAPTVLDHPETVVAEGALIDITTTPAQAAAPPTEPTANPHTTELPPPGPGWPSSERAAPADTDRTPIQAGRLPSRTPPRPAPSKPPPDPAARRRRRRGMAVGAAGALVISLACVVVLYFTGVFTEDGPYHDAVDACALAKSGAFRSSYIDSQRRQPGGHGMVRTCRVTFEKGDPGRLDQEPKREPGNPSILLTTERLDNHGTQAPHDYAWKLMDTRQKKAKTLRTTVQAHAYYICGSHGSGGYVVTNSNGLSATAVCWVDNLIVSAALHYTSTPPKTSALEKVRFLITDVIEALPPPT